MRPHNLKTRLILLILLALLPVILTTIHAALYQGSRASSAYYAFPIILAGIMAAILWYGGNLVVLRPIRALTRAAQRLGEGDLTVRTGLPREGDELGRLAGAFDDMAAALQSQHNALQKWDGELKRANRALRTLSHGNRIVTRATSEDELLGDMCKAIVDIGGYALAWIAYAVNDEVKSIQPKAQAGFKGHDFNAFIRSLNITWADAERGRGPVGTAIRTGRHHMVKNVDTDPNFVPWRKEARKYGHASCVAFPLKIDDDIIGALAIYSHETDAFDDAEVELLEETAQDLSFGLSLLRSRQRHQQADETIKRMAYYDSLTGLPNRQYLEEYLNQAIVEAAQYNQPLAVLLLDVDRFREINDTLGYQQGNLLVKNMGPRLRHVLPDSALIARTGEDEFGIALPACGTNGAQQIAQRMINIMERPFPLAGLMLDVQASIGISLFPGHGIEPEQLLRRADIALHQAKRTGMGYALYTPGHDQGNPRRLALAGELRQAVDHRTVILHYQPKVDMRTGKVSGVEALARWQHPQYGTVTPGEFIPLAEHTGLIRPLTYLTLEMAARMCYQWRRAGMDVPLAVNLSPRCLHDIRLMDRVKGFFAAWDIQPGQIEIEITEGAIMSDPSGALHVLRQLSDMGVVIYIDDFGTGYSSMSYLKRLPVDGLKIDKSFVMDMLSNKDSLSIVRSAVDLAHDLDLTVVAEGVEHQSSWEQLTDLGCDVAQGYYISHPLSGRDFERWLTNYRDGKDMGKEPPLKAHTSDIEPQ